MSSIKGPSLLVTQQTSAVDILNLVSQAKNDGMKLVAQNTKEGTVLFLRDAGSDMTIGDKLSRFFEKIGSSDAKQLELTKNVINSVIDRVEKVLRGRSTTKPKRAYSSTV